jgi:hypothetical protein
MSTQGRSQSGQHEDSMDVIGHDDEGIQDNV